MQVTVQSRPPGNIPPRPNPLTSTTPPPYPPNFPWVDTGVDIPNGYNLTITEKRQNIAICLDIYHYQIRTYDERARNPARALPAA